MGGWIQSLKTGFQESLQWYTYKHVHINRYTQSKSPAVTSNPTHKDKALLPKSNTVHTIPLTKTLQQQISGIMVRLLEINPNRQNIMATV